MCEALGWEVDKNDLQLQEAMAWMGMMETHASKPGSKCCDDSMPKLAQKL